MNVLVIGSGGREHALVWKIKQSPKVSKIFCAPGNAGISAIAECVNINSNDINGLIDFAKKNNIDLTVVGPEDPLVNGIVDEFEKQGLKIFGPSKKAAQLEGSKIFSKQFFAKYNIPSADFEVFSDKDSAKEYVLSKGLPQVVKYDGLAGGKGVYICLTKEDLENALDEIFVQHKFGLKDINIVVEDFLEGPEASILAFCDGKNAILLDSSQDHKRAYDGDKGPNTGGMGTYSPAPVVTEELKKQIYKEIIMPTVTGMAKEGAVYKGILYAGLILTNNGPKVLEYNARFGDPETQVVLPRMQSDIVELMLASIKGTLAGKEIKWTDDACVCVVLTSGGYPGFYEKGKNIFFRGGVEAREDVMIFHAGTAFKDGKLVTAGGRVFGLTVLGKDIRKCIDKAYSVVNCICFEGMFYRKDIAHRAV